MNRDSFPIISSKYLDTTRNSEALDQYAGRRHFSVETGESREINSYSHKRLKKFNFADV